MGLGEQFLEGFGGPDELQPYDLPNGYFLKNELGEIYSIENNHWVGHRVAIHLGHQSPSEIAPTDPFGINPKAPHTRPPIGLQPVGLQLSWATSSHQNSPELAPTDHFRLNPEVPTTRPSIELQLLGLQPISAVSSHQSSPEISPRANFRLNHKVRPALRRLDGVHAIVEVVFGALDGAAGQCSATLRLRQWL